MEEVLRRLAALEKENKSLRGVIVNFNKRIEDLKWKMIVNSLPKGARD